MAYPSEEFLKILTEKVNALEQQLYGAHPTDEAVHYGVTGAVDDGQQFLKVYPYTPSVDSDGNLTWQTPKDFYDALDDDAPYDKVYVIGLPATEYINCFGPYLIIKYWAYEGAGDDQDNVKGTYVTELPKMRFLITAVDGSFPIWNYTGQLILYAQAGVTDYTKWVTNNQDVPLLNDFEEEVDSFPYLHAAGFTVTDDMGTISDGVCVVMPFAVGAVVEVTLSFDNEGNPLYTFSLPNSGDIPPSTSSGA